MQDRQTLARWGEPRDYSLGLAVTMAPRQIDEGIRQGRLLWRELEGARKITRVSDGKWFLQTRPFYSAMLGAACGDVAGSVYEFHNIKHRLAPEELIRSDAYFTDDTVMTFAVAKGLRMGLELLPEDWMSVPAAGQILSATVEETMLVFGHRYPNAGYGGNFHRWLSSAEPRPYNSFGNGSAMRASYAGWAARTMEEAECLAEISARVTHNHPEGVKGAVAVAGSIFLLRCGASKEEIRAYGERFYDLGFTLDEIRPDYRFDVTCQGSVPHAIVAFLEGEDFADVLSRAVSIGGDSDTIAAIAGSLAEVIYPIPPEIREEVLLRLDRPMVEELEKCVDFFFRRLQT